MYYNGNNMGWNDMGYGLDDLNGVNRVDGVNNGYNYRRPAKRDIINWFKDFVGAGEVDLVDEASDAIARHVCIGGNNIELLPRGTYTIQFPDGDVILEYYQCNLCRKLILGKNFM